MRVLFFFFFGGGGVRAGREGVYWNYLVCGNILELSRNNILKAVVWKLEQIGEDFDGGCVKENEVTAL